MEKFPNDEVSTTWIPQSILRNPMWNIVLLALAWAFTLTTSTLLTTIGPLSAQNLGASDSLSAFTVGIFLIGAAVSSVPSAQLFEKFGRFYGFSFGCLCQCIGSAFGATAMTYEKLELIYIGCFFVGLGQGLGQFYRFSAVEVTPDHLKSRAITYVLSGGIIAAFLGPTSANSTAKLAGHEFVGSYLTMAVIGVANEITIALVNFESTTKLHHAQLVASSISIRRPIMAIIKQPMFVISCSVATIAHTMMVILMSNVTLAMKSDDYSLAATSLVMELHFFAMFAPGFFTGRMIGLYGSFIVAAVGGVIFLGSAVVFLIGTAEWNYIVGMILLGIGWNFSFSAGTVMLTESYLPHEATSVQAINDFILFTVAGGGSLASGFVYAVYGWKNLVYAVGGMMILNMGLFVVARSVKNFNPLDLESTFAKLMENESRHSSDSHVTDPRHPSMESYPMLERSQSISGVETLNESQKLGFVRSISVA